MMLAVGNSRLKINFLVALVVFFNAIAPLSILMPETANAEEAGMEQLFGDKILICTPFGFKYVSFDELSEMQDDAQGAKDNHCPLCLVSFDEQSLYTIDLSEIYKIERREIARNVYIFGKEQKSKVLYRTDNPRAPPSYI